MNFEKRICVLAKFSIINKCRYNLVFQKDSLCQNIFGCPWPQNTQCWDFNKTYIDQEHILNVIILQYNCWCQKILNLTTHEQELLCMHHSWCLTQKCVLLFSLGPLWLLSYLLLLLIVLTLFTSYI